MNLFEINQEIASLINEETGEILDFEKFTELQMSLDDKIENIALWHLNLLSDAAQLKEQKDKFAEREKSVKKKADDLKNYLDMILQGNKWKSAKVSVGYRNSQKVIIDDAKKVPDEYMKYKDPEPDKTALKNAIKNGLILDGVHIENASNIQIK